MKKLIIPIVLMCVLTIHSCAPMKITLKGTYPARNHYATTDASFEEVWTKVIDLFATSGISITTIDKSSGIIISSRMSFLNNYTRETSDGSVINSSAYVAIPKQGGIPNSIVGDWNARIKETEKGTVININLMNLACSSPAVFLYGAQVGGGNMPVQSTGVFEKQLLQLFK